MKYSNAAGNAPTPILVTRNFDLLVADGIKKKTWIALRAVCKSATVEICFEDANVQILKIICFEMRS